MKLPSLEDEGERRIVDKRLRLLATISLLSMIVPFLVSSLSVHTTFVIASSSMNPTLMPGDIVTTSLTNGEIANGTIIVFKSPFGGYEAHRVVGESSLGKDVYYSTKGDANNRTDSFLVSGAYIVGPVSRVIPKLGLFFMIPREIVLLATISLVFLYVFLTFKTRDESDKRESTDQLKEDQEQRRKKRIFQTCCVISILVLTNCVTSFASIKLIYCTSPNTASLTSPKVVLQNGNTESSTIYDNGINANVTVQALLWLSSWKYRSQMTLDHNDVTSNLSNFPTLIYLSSSSGINGADVINIFNEVGSNSKKIAITSDGITQCYVEIEKWDSVSKKAWLWVKVPSISSTIDTVLYIYYDSSQQDNTAYVGDPGSVTAQNVWESNFMAVLHLTETSGTHYDSTPNSNIGTPQGGVTQGNAGKVDGADTFDGTSGYVNYGTSTSLNFGVNSPFTFEGWVKTTESYGAIISQRHGTDDGAVIDICVGYDGAVRSAGCLMGLVRQSSGSSGYARVTGPIVNDGNWHYFTLTRNSGNTIELFVDGISQGTASGSASGGAITTNLRALGSERRWEQDGFGTADDRYLNGAIDEVRTSNIQRSAAWIKASYESERDHFVSWGSQGTLSGWGYRKSHVINPSTGAGTNYQVRITTYYGSGTDSGANVYLNSKSRTDFGDVRFTDDDGTTLLDYWIESKVDGNNAVFLVEVADDLSSVSRTIYLYYGKSDATTTSSGVNTFNFFDEGDQISSWTTGKVGSGSAGQSSIIGNPAPSYYINSPDAGNYAWMKRDISLTTNKIIEFDMQTDTSLGLYSVLDVAFLVTTDGYGQNFRSEGRVNEKSGFAYKDSWTAFNWGAPASGTYYSTGTWHKAKIEIGSTQAKGWIDGAYQPTSPYTLRTTAGNTFFGIEWSGRIDNIRVRKFVDPEPSHGTWGSEERVSATYYVLRIYNTVADPWRIRLRAYSDSNVNRLGNCTIYLHNGGTSRQIYISGGSYVQQVGGWYDLAASGTDYIAVSVSASSSGTSIIYAYLEVIVSNSGVSTLYKITFNIT